MEYRPFGRTGLDVSAIGFGCWEIGGGYGEIEEHGVRVARSGARSTSASTASTPPRATAWAPRSRRSARRSPAAATRPSSSPSSAWIPRQAQLSATAAASGSSPRSTRACRTSAPTTSTCTSSTGPTATRRSRRRWRARGGRAAGQGPLRRRVELLGRRHRDLQARPDRVDVAQYGCNMFDRRMERDVLPYCGEHGIGVHGVRVARLRPPDRHAHQGHRTSARRRLAVEDRQVGAMAPLFDRRCSARSRSRATSARSTS